MQIESSMNAAEIIQKIEAMPDDEKGKVIEFIRQLAQEKYNEEQIQIASQRLDDFENGVQEAIPHEDAMRRLRGD